MYNYIPEVEDFEPKTKLLTGLMNQLSREYDVSYVHIDYLMDMIGLSNNELDSLIYYLKRGEIIKTDMDQKLIKLTSYGRMVYCDNCNIPNAPILG